MNFLSITADISRFGQDTEGSCLYSAARQTSTNLGSITIRLMQGIESIVKKQRLHFEAERQGSSTLLRRLVQGCMYHPHKEPRWLFAADFRAWGDVAACMRSENGIAKRIERLYGFRCSRMYIHTHN